MQVDNTNFKDQLPSILKSIQAADFIAFDCQFTGLVTKLERIQGSFSNHIQFYERIKETAYNFRIIQFGLAAFVYENEIYKPYVYNFYVSPSTFTRGYNNVMVCEVQSMQFLAKNKLDFNKVFCNGIKSKRLYSNDIKQKHQYDEFPTFQFESVFFSPEEEEYVNHIEMKIIKEIQDNPKDERIVDFRNKTIFAYFRHKYLDMILDKGKKVSKQFEYIIRFRPKIVKEEQKKVMDTESENKSKENNIQIKQKQIKEEKMQEKMVEQEEVGLQKVFYALIAGRKPLIGHFPNLDIGLIFQNFIADLPQTYQQFCYNLNQILPYLFDTKVLSRRLQSRLKGLKVDLGSLFKACSNPKLLKPYANFDITGLQNYIEKQHEAGYDAFITGCSFIGMTNYLNGKAQRINFKCIQQQNMLLYSRYSGQVSLSGNGYASNALNYDNTMIIQPFPKVSNLQWQNMAKLLSKFGSLTVHEDRQEIYYVYEEPKNIEEIIGMFPQYLLKRYGQRKIIYARNMYSKGNNMI